MEYTLNKTYCNNCGNYGHAYKDCRHPILSYGIILYNDKSEVIMVERKDTLSYIEFMRGKYKSIYNKDYLKLLFQPNEGCNKGDIDHDGIINVIDIVNLVNFIFETATPVYYKDCTMNHASA